MADPWLALLGWLLPPPLGSWHGCLFASGWVLPTGLGTPDGRWGGTWHIGSSCAVRAAGPLDTARVGKEPARGTPALLTSSREESATRCHLRAASLPAPAQLSKDAAWGAPSQAPSRSRGSAGRPVASAPAPGDRVPDAATGKQVGGQRGSGQARSPGARGLHALGVRVAWVLPGTRGLQESDRVAFRLFPRQETREGALGRGCGSDKGWGPGGWGDSDPGGHSLT